MTTLIKRLRCLMGWHEWKWTIENIGLFGYVPLIIERCCWCERPRVRPGWWARVWGRR